MGRHKIDATNDMNEKFERACQQMVELVRWNCLVRPKYDNYYKNADGQFDLNELKKDMRFLKGWRTMSATQKGLLARKYSACAKRFNMCFGLPVELVKKVVGYYKDENGKVKHVSIDKVVERLVNEGKIRVLNNGTKLNAENKVKCWWSKKYLLNYDEWMKSIDNPEYTDKLYDWMSVRVAKIIYSWVRKDEQPKVETTKVETTKVETTKVDDEVESNKLILWRCANAGLIKGEALIKVLRMVFNMDEEKIAKWVELTKDAKIPNTWNEEALKRNQDEMIRRIRTWVEAMKK